MNKRRIVIIEDNIEVREGFATLLNNNEGYEVINEYNLCESALQHLHTDKPDAVLMDIELPGGITGIEGTALIKKKLPQCIVIIITVFNDTEKVFRSLCAGANGYIIKSSSTQDIVSNVSEAFFGGAPMSLSIAKMVVQSFQHKNNSPLSPREAEVLQGIAQGKSHTIIATELFVSKETIKSHIKNIYEKLSVNNKVEALKIANNNKWIIRGEW